MKIFTRILDVLCKIFKWITALILAAMLVASVAEIIRRYIELGGETFTIGADAHEPSCVGDHFAELKELLIQCGVRYIAKFKNRQAAYFPIEEI